MIPALNSKVAIIATLKPNRFKMSGIADKSPDGSSPATALIS